MSDPTNIFDLTLQRPDLNRVAHGPDVKIALLIATLEIALGDRAQAIEFCRRLAGCALIIPPTGELERLLAQDVVFKAMSRDASRQSRRRLAELLSRDGKSIGLAWRKYQRLAHARLKSEYRQSQAEGQRNG